MSILVDTDVLIWHLRGFAKATVRLDTLDALRISSISYLEILQGVRNKAELQAIQKMLQKRQAEQILLTPAITQQATVLMEELALSHGLGLGDALIAATALQHDLTVLTANSKHFKPVQHLKIEVFEV